MDLVLEDEMVDVVLRVCARVAQRLTRRTLKLRAVQSGTLPDLRTTASQKCGAVPRRDRI